MRTALLLGALSFAAGIAVAADLQPLNVKPGLWQVTTTTTYQGLGAPETKTYRSCVSAEDLNRYPFPDRDNDCRYQVVSSTGTHMEVGGSCTPQGAKADFKLRLEVIDAEDVQGNGELNVAGPQGEIHGVYTGKGKWLGASCPPGTK